MVKGNLRFFSILAVLVLSMLVVSAAESNLIYSGNGSSSNPLVGNPNAIVNFNVTINSSFLEDIYVNWSVASGSYITNLPNGDNYTNGTTQVSGFEFTMPSSGASYRVLTANVYNSTTMIGIETKTINVYFNVNVETPVIEEENACFFEKGVNESGNLRIRNFDVSNKGVGRDNRWEFFDSIEVEVEVENIGNDDVDDVEVRLIILDSSGNDVTPDFDLNKEIEDLRRLRDGNRRDVVFEIEVPYDVEVGDYYLYIMVYSDGAEDEHCISNYKDDLYYEFSIEDIEYKDAISVRNLPLSVSAFCGQNNLEIKVPVYNLYDLDEEKVLVKIFNSELQIDQVKTILKLRDRSFDEVSFFVSIPDFLDRTMYDLSINLYYDWDGNDEYEIMSYDETAKSYLRLVVSECGAPAPSMIPELQSIAQEGTELVVKTTVTNNGVATDSFEFFVSGHEAWAELISINPETVTLGAGESVDVIVILLPKTSGTQSFRITSRVGDNSYNQPVSVNIKELQGLNSIFGVNEITFYLLTGILGLLLLIFFVLLVKVLRRSGKH